MKRQDGYFIGNDYILTWVFGHLFSLADVEAYAQNPVENKKWTMDEKLVAVRVAKRLGISKAIHYTNSPRYWN